MTSARHVPGAVAAVAAVAIGVLVVSLALPWREGIGGAAALLFVAYIVSLLLGSRAVDVWAPLVAAGLFALVELAAWSVELADGGEERYGVHARRVVLLAAAAALPAALVLAVGSARIGAGLVFVVLGAAAAVALAALIAAPTQRGGDRVR